MNHNFAFLIFSFLLTGYVFVPWTQFLVINRNFRKIRYDCYVTVDYINSSTISKRESHKHKKRKNVPFTFIVIEIWNKHRLDHSIYLSKLEWKTWPPQEILRLIAKHVVVTAQNSSWHARINVLLKSQVLSEVTPYRLVKIYLSLELF